MITVIGNTPVDLIADVTDEFLARYGLDKGYCTTITLEQQDILLQATSYKRVPGGSGANLASSLALLDAPVHYIGPFGDDECGHLSLDSLRTLGIACAPYKQPIPNQLVFILLTPDGERSFAALYDVRTEVPPAALIIPPETDLLVVDGYMALYPRYAESLRAVLPAYQGKLVFCPNDVSVILQSPAMADWLYKRADIVVMNRDEAETLLKPHVTETILNRLQADGKSGALTLGAEGAVLFTPDDSLIVPSVLNPKDFVDSNGAGDAFTAGYLYGMEQGWDLAKIGTLASRCAAVVLATCGARAPDTLHDIVFKETL